MYCGSIQHISQFTMCVSYACLFPGWGIAMLTFTIHICCDLFRPRRLCASCVMSCVSCLPFPRVGEEACHTVSVATSIHSLGVSSDPSLLWGMNLGFPAPLRSVPSKLQILKNVSCKCVGGRTWQQQRYRIGA